MSSHHDTLVSAEAWDVARDEEVTRIEWRYLDDPDPIRHAEAMRLGMEAWARFRAARDGGA